MARSTNKTMQVIPTGLDPKVYKVKPPRRHRGSVNTKAVPGTGRSSGKNKKK